MGLGGRRRLEGTRGPEGVEDWIEVLGLELESKAALAVEQDGRLDSARDCRERSVRCNEGRCIRKLDCRDTPGFEFEAPVVLRD